MKAMVRSGVHSIRSDQVHSDPFQVGGVLVQNELCGILIELPIYLEISCRFSLWNIGHLV